MSDRKISVTPRARPDGIDIDGLALALLTFTKGLSRTELERLAADGEAILKRAAEDVAEQTDSGSAA